MRVRWWPCSMRRVGLSTSLLIILCATSFAQLAGANPDDGAITKIHEKGRCAIRGNCGSENFWNPQLPCPDNGLAGEVDKDLGKRLVEVCGDKWVGVEKVCCEAEQIDALEENLKQADKLIGSCPACRANFVNLFCTFTCSPDQSLFVNVLHNITKNDKQMVTELDHLVSDEYGSAFFDSCREVKFGGTGGRAMDLIGGGANNYTEFLAFLGKKQFLGSPFQMNFPRPDEKKMPDGMSAMDDKTRKCNDPDREYRCSCVDCPGSCQKPPKIRESKECRVGILPCLSFAAIVVYAAFVLIITAIMAGHVAYEKHTRHKNERLRLLHDAAAGDSDEEDEGDLVHNAALLSKPQRHYRLNSICDAAFAKLGYVCAEFPAITISMCLMAVVFMSLGWMRFEVETSPVRLWVAPDSPAAREKAFFDEKFGPFFRAEQAFLVNDTHGSPGPVLSYETLAWWFDVEGRISRLRAPGGITLDDVCFKPTDSACVVQSVSGYFNEVPLGPLTWQNRLKECVNSPVTCRPKFEQPLAPKMVFGNFTGNVLDTQALVATWVVNNHPEGSKELKRAMEFEQALKQTLLDVQREATDRGLRLSFNTEISLEQELNKSTNTDARIVVISYVVMFIYASLALGSTSLGVHNVLSDPKNALVHSKFMLGVSGIIIVLMSVSASVGLFSAMGIKVTLIIAEVIPFLVLAVGVDNIFLIVHEFERVNLNYPEGSVSLRMAKALGRMGPSILLSAATETVAFSLGAAVGMPAVRNFAAYAAGAVFVNAVLQVTMFVSVLALNQRRVEAGRADCVPCLRITPRQPGHGSLMYGMEDESTLQRYIRRVYAPALLKSKVKVGVVSLFLGLFAAGVALLPKVELGLDQRIAIPSDSYLIQYFNDLDAHFGVGPPVYFVTRELNVTQRRHQEQLCGRFVACNDYSLTSLLELERQRPRASYIADSTASWVDDFFLWLNPAIDTCCIEKGKPCLEGRDPPWNPHLRGMPEGEEYIRYLTKWLKAPTNTDCPLAGKAAYRDAVVVDSERVTIEASHFRTAHTPLKSQKDFIAAYRSARRIASEISARNADEDGKLEVFPYSTFYIFFDQYLTISRLAFTLLGTGCLAVLALAALLLGSIRTSIVVTATVAMTLVDILGAMAIAGVSLNAVSLVNLVISLGIALEFCAHVARAFVYPSTSVLELAPRHAFAGSGGGTGATTSPGLPPEPYGTTGSGRDYGGPAATGNGTTSRAAGLVERLVGSSDDAAAKSRDSRAWAALVNVGASVVSGITITKFLGVAVLAFTRSKIFEVYYFRVWVALVVLASAHALVFLPVALSLFGGRGYVDNETDGGLERDLRSRRYPPLLDEYDSDDDYSPG